MNNYRLPGNITEKRTILKNTASCLKKEFVGLNDIIDEIINLITPWYLYPELQKKPTIINLWGMTGVGKTSLVKRLVQLIDFNEHFFSIEMGENSENFKNIYCFFKRFMKALPGQPFILGLDEFQYANSKNSNGLEIEKAYFRSLWDILDTGTYQVYKDTYISEEMVEIISELKFYLSKGIVVENGVIVKKADYYLQLEDEKGSYDLFDDINGNKKISKVLFVKPSYIRTIFNYADNYRHVIELKDQLLQLNGEETIQLIEKTILKTQSRKPVDCTKALVLIMGNLDEAYEFASELNPDISADAFYNQSKKITINVIKEALQSRFRNEQIARLGNNHIIYPAFSKHSFEKIIETELNKVALWAKDEFGLKIRYHHSINKLLYNEGVYPTQGTRPLFSTISKIIETHVSILPALIEEHALKSNEIELKFSSGHLGIYFIHNGSIEFQKLVKLKLSLNNLKAARKDSLQAVTAVHESGHALVSALLLGVLPNQIFSITTDSDDGGMMVSENGDRMVWNKSSVIRKAAVCLSGLVAEKLIFGEENITSGSASDVISATTIISALVKKQGLAGKPYHVDVEDARTGTAVFDEEYSFNKMVQELLDLAYEQATKTLANNLPLLKELSVFLADKPIMNQKQFLKIVAKYAPGNNPDLLIPKPINYRDILFKKSETEIDFNTKEGVDFMLNEALIDD